MIYTSLENPRVKDLRRLHTKKYRDEAGLFLVEGEHLVEEAYKAGFLETLICEEGCSFSLNGVDMMVVSHPVFMSLTELETPKPVMGVCRKKENVDLTGNILVLENIQDPGNLGTIIRSAVAFRMGGILISEDTVDPYNSKVVRASQGLLFQIPFRIGNLYNELSSLKTKGYTILGTKVTNGKNIKTIEKKSQFAIIMGNEGQGMSEMSGRFCDEFVYIDMSDKCESLNVGVAASILMYELDK